MYQKIIDNIGSNDKGNKFSSDQSQLNGMLSPDSGNSKPSIVTDNSTSQAVSQHKNPTSDKEINMQT